MADITTSNVQSFDDLTETSTLASGDELAAWDVSDSAHKKITTANLETSLATFADSTPTEDSEHLITSAAVYSNCVRQAGTLTENTLTNGLTTPSVIKSPAVTASFTTTAVTPIYIEVCSIPAYFEGDILLRVYGGNIEDKIRISSQSPSGAETKNNTLILYAKNNLTYGSLIVYSYVSSNIRYIWLKINPYSTSVFVSIYKLTENSTGQITSIMTSQSTEPTYTWSHSLTDAYCGVITKNLMTDAVIPAMSTPSSSSDTGIAGSIWADTDYIYVQTASGTVKRAALSTF